MPTWYNSDGTKRPVSQEEYDRLQDEADAVFYEAYALAKWFAWCEWVDEFGEDNTKFPFDANKLSIFTEAERLLNN